MIDLHTHSTASDGSLSPRSLIDLANKIGLKALALTDHDTVAGLDEAVDAAARTDLIFVPGVELSAFNEKGSLHIVGLHIDHKNPRLASGLQRVLAMRKERNPRIVKRLEELGMHVSLEDAAELAGGEVVGRPHFARAMVDRGYARDSNDAFARFLGKNGAACVFKERLDSAECIDLIRGAGGVPILAHPDQTGLEGEDLDEFVGQLVDMGLKGIEVFCSSYKSHLTAQYTRLARKYDLVRSGGTDFHGAPKPNIKLGRGFGSLYVPDELLEPISLACLRRQMPK